MLRADGLERVVLPAVASLLRNAGLRLPSSEPLAAKTSESITPNDYGRFFAPQTTC